MNPLLRHIGLGLVLGAALLFWNGWNSAPLAHADADACQLVWNHIHAPQVSAQDILYSVHALNANDVWAVGSADGATLTAHWDGSAWSIVTSPNAASGANELRAAFGSAANDVWAVGHNRISDTETRALLLHWDGSAWNMLPAPLGNVNHALAAIDGLNANNVWAVGWYQDGSATKNLVLHWDGNTWTQVAADTPPQTLGGLDAIDVFAPNDIWAAGAGIYHWNGSAWQRQSDVTVQGLAAFAPNDVWFVEQNMNGFLHWNGKHWKVFPPGASPYLNGFVAIDGAAANNLYAIGSAYAHGSLGVIQHFNGKAWQEIPSPAEARNTYLNDLSVVSPAELWVVGSFNSFLPPPNAGSEILHGVMNCDAPPAKAPTLLTPSNSSTVTQRRPVLMWRALKNATSYRVQIRETVGDWKMQADVNGTQYKTPRLKFNTQYSWRVRACNPAGCGAWSDYFTFTVK